MHRGGWSSQRSATFLLMDIFLRIAFYVLTGLALAGAGVWYIQSLYRTMTGRGEIVIAPIVIVGDGDQANRGLALAHMLHARLSEIESDIRRAQNELMTDPAAAPLDSHAESSGHQTAAATGTQYPMPQLLTQAVELHTRLLESANIDVSVGGVQVSGLVTWLQREIAPDPLVLTLYEGKGTTQVSGSLRSLGVRDDAIRVPLSAQPGADSVPADTLIERTAYEIVRRRLAQEAGNRVEVLNAVEFQTLVEVLRDTAQLNRRVALGRGALPEFQDLLARVSGLADAVPEWYQLNYLAANIAESAKDPERARHFYEQARSQVARDPKQNALAQNLRQKVAALDKQLAATSDTGTAAETADASAQSARERIKGYLVAANNYLNAFFQQTLPVPSLLIKGNPGRDGWASYWDGKRVVVPQAAQYLPDIVYRESSWPHIMRVVGSDALDRNDDTETILYSYADILPVLIQQHELKQDEKSSHWELSPGFQEVASGQDFEKIKTRTPYLSFAALDTGGNRAVGGISQVGHMRDFDSHSNRTVRNYVNCGILNRAFYETAKRISSLRAAQVWGQALTRLRGQTRVDFFRFAQLLYESAPASERMQVRDALAVVGLDTQVSSG